MNQSIVNDKPSAKTLEERKAALKSQLEQEERISRRQELFKKIWKIDRQQSEMATSAKS